MDAGRTGNAANDGSEDKPDDVVVEALLDSVEADPGVEAVRVCCEDALMVVVKSEGVREAVRSSGKMQSSRQVEDSERDGEEVAAREESDGSSATDDGTEVAAARGMRQ